MAEFPVHTVASAPGGGAEAMSEAKKLFGFVPNLVAVLAEAPAAAEAYLALTKLFERTTLSPVEQQVVLLAASFENRCDYCMAAHSTVAVMLKMRPDALAALRNGDTIGDAKTEALRRFTQIVVRRRGDVGSEDVEAFVAAGYTPRNVLEVILGVAMKTLSNYTNHIAGTPLDAAFQAREWRAAAAAAR